MKKLRAQRTEDREQSLRAFGSPSTNPHSLLTSDLCSLSSARSGISLLEVLISMFILAVGLLSIASLLPVGTYQVQKASIEDRKSTIGQNAFNEFRTRGMSNADMWLHYFAPGGRPVIVSGSVNAQLSQNYSPLSVAIDPLCLSNGNVGIGGEDSKLFPRLPAGVRNDDLSQPRMPRVGLGNVRQRQIAEQIFMSHDDAVFEKTADPDAPPISKWEEGSGQKIRRQFEGNFSWLVTLTPAHTDTTPGPMTRYKVSIAIFFKRNLNSRTNPEGVEVERIVGVSNNPTALAGFGLGGGGLSLKGTAANTAVQPGNWVLVSGRYQVIGIPRGVPVFRWYRVVVAGDYDSGAAERAISVAGPDWIDLPNAQANWRCRPTHVAIFENCVGVFEKTVHLEGPSVWSN